MFFKKSLPVVKPSYSLGVDAAMDGFEIFIDLSAFKESILSIERNNINTPEEVTVVYTDSNGKINDYDFVISRKQHAELVNQYKKILEATK